METAALSFERTWVLNALWLLPLVVALFWWSEQRRKSAIGRIVAPKLRALLAGNASPLRRWFRSVCVVGALGLLVIALAGPRLGYDTLEVPHRGRDVIIAMDVSRSMLAPDVVPTRLDRAKLFAEDLIGELGSDRIGLVAFAGSAFLQAPLTLDHGAVLAALDELDTTVIPKGGTNLAEAIGTADDAFGKAEGFSRAVVIVSDGEELSEDGVAAAKKAAGQGVRIFTVGVGSPEGSEIPDGAGEFIRDPDTQKIVNSRLDESRMKEIAEATGGFYTRLDDGAAGRIAADGIGKMQEADITANSSRRPIERYQWPLGAAIGLLVLQALVGERRRRLAAAMLAAGAFWTAGAEAAPAGIEAYEQGNYEKAREAFESRLRMEPNAPELQLNAGTAAYRLKDYAKASQYFSRAALTEDPAIRSVAEYNFANTLFRQGEGQQDKEKKATDWKEAIAKYDAALKSRPDYKEAKENKERVEQLLKELEKEQKQDEKKQDQQKQDQQQQQEDQQKQKEESKDERKQDQQSGGGQQREEKGDQQKTEEERQDGQKEEEQKKDQQGGEQQKEEEKSGGEQQESRKNEEGQKGEDDEQHSQPGQNRPPSGQSDDERGPVPQQPQEKKEGELRGAGQPQGGKEGEEQARAAALAEEEKDGEMSETQARALLRAMQSEEGKVDLLERQIFQDVSKDW